VSTRLLHIAPVRLRRQLLAGGAAADVPAVVQWMGAVQAQDYAGARWALGLRAKGATDATVERAFDSGAILRTHMMRPTWHFVAPQDIRWMQALTSPRVHAGSRSIYRKLELDERVLAKGRMVFERALVDGAHLTRTELAAALARAGIAVSGIRLAYLVMYAELEQVICSGPRRGRQFTYALLADRVPPAPALDPDEALAALARRYFTSHGPATVRDFVWWSGLKVGDARLGIELAGAALDSAPRNGLTYWFAEGALSRSAQSRTRATGGAFLLPNYDEYLIAYRDRGTVAPRAGAVPARELLPYHLVLDGRVVGSWRPRDTPRDVVLDIAPYQRLTRKDTADIRAAAERYAHFLERTVTVPDI